MSKLCQRHETFGAALTPAPSKQRLSSRIASADAEVKYRSRKKLAEMGCWNTFLISLRWVVRLHSTGLTANGIPQVYALCFISTRIRENIMRNIRCNQYSHLTTTARDAISGSGMLGNIVEGNENKSDERWV